MKVNFFAFFVLLGTASSFSCEISVFAMVANQKAICHCNLRESDLMQV